MISFFRTASVSSSGWAGLPAAPSLILALGSVFLSLWRPAGRRAGWIAESSFAALGLLAALVMGRAIPASVRFSLWPAEPTLPAVIELRLTPWTWALLVSLLAFSLCESLAHGRTDPEQTRRSRAAWMGFCAALGLAILSATPLAIVLTWTLAIGAQLWLGAEAGRSGPATAPWDLVRGRDIGTLVCLIAAFGLASPRGSDPSPWGYAFLMAAGYLRLSSAVWPAQTEDSTRGPTVARLGLPTALAVFAALGSGFTAGGSTGFGPWLVTAGILMLLLGLPSQWLADTSDGRARAWIFSLSGIALMAAAVSPETAAAGLGASGVLMIVAGSLVVSLPLGGLTSRGGPAIAGASTVGIPLTTGVLLLGVLVPENGGTALGWAAVLALGLLASRLLVDLLRPQKPNSSDTVAGVAGGLIILVGVVLVLRLRSLVSPPAVYAPLVALAAALAAAVPMARLPAAQRDRVARALRWPVTLSWRGLLRPVVGPVESFLRGVRDLLEGDASLLWAFVVVAIAMILFQGAR